MWFLLWGYQIDPQSRQTMPRLGWNRAHPSFFGGVSWGGVRLSPLGTSANIWHIVPAPDVRWWVWSRRWNDNWQGKPKYSEKTCLSATWPTTNPTWPDLGSNPGHPCGKPATNRLSYGTARSHPKYNYRALGYTVDEVVLGKTSSEWFGFPY
jgi:hypothetical protein